MQERHTAYMLVDKRMRSGGDHMNALETDRVRTRTLIEYGLTGWQVELDRAVRRFGRCSYVRKLITLSEALVELNDQAQVLDVILHEIAHPLAGPGTHHGPEWKSIARAVSCSAERCYSAAAKQPHAPLVLRCPHCSHSSNRNRKRSPSTGMQYVLWAVCRRPIRRSLSASLRASSGFTSG